MNHYESVYMIRQNSECAYETISTNYQPLMWKTSYENFLVQKPFGIQVKDLVQEAHLGLTEAVYTYRESKAVRLPYYVQICVESHVLSCLRRCRGLSYQLLDTNYSLDMLVSEDQKLSLADTIATKYRDHNPRYMSMLEEAKKELHKAITDITQAEKDILHHWLEGFTYKEIATIIGCNPKDVDNTLQKIKRLLSLPTLN